MTTSTSSPSRLAKLAADIGQMSQTARSPSSSDTLVTNSTSQLRSTLALGQLIASNRPTAGSKLVAGEIKLLNKTIQDESASLRKEIANLSASLTSTLKTVMTEDREARNVLASNPLLSRRNALFNRRIPVYRRPRYLARKSLAPRDLSFMNQSTNTPRSPDQAHGAISAPSTSSASTGPTSTSSSSVASDQNDSSNADRALKTVSTKATSHAIKALQLLFKSSWLPNDRSAYDGETDSDSTETTPGSSP